MADRLKNRNILLSANQYGTFIIGGLLLTVVLTSNVLLFLHSLSSICSHPICLVFALDQWMQEV